MMEASALSSRELLDVYLLLDRELDASVLVTEAQTVAAVTALAVRVVPGVEQASITSRRDGGRFRTLGATGPMAASAAAIQYDLGSGPCVDAIADDSVCCTGDVANDIRWPVYGQRAHTQAGVMSMLSFRLFYDEQSHRAAGLNLYSTQLDAFGEHAETIGTVLATHSARTLAAATASERAANLELALVTNRRIGAAIGILMATHKVTDDDAFTLLRAASQTFNRKLVDVAEDVITTGMLEMHAATNLGLRPPDRGTAAPPPQP